MPSVGHQAFVFIPQKKCVCVQPHWLVSGDTDGRWSVEIEMTTACEEQTETLSEEEVIRL